MSSNPSEIPIQYIKGVGPAKAKLLINLGIHTVEDLLNFFPRRYEDRSVFTPISKLQAGQIYCVTGHVLAVGKRNFYSKNKTFEIAIGNNSGKLFCAWFNQPYLDKFFKVGQEIVCYGKVDVYKGRVQLVMPDFELITDEDRMLNMGRIVPVYPLTKGISQKYLRRIIDLCLKEHVFQVKDIIPSDIRQRQGLSALFESIHQIHFPQNYHEQGKASNRIAFEEFFLFQVSVILRRLSVVLKEGKSFEINERLKSNYLSALPFALTNAQSLALDAICQDLKQPKPMLRLLQGDVGCGKTAVAFFAAITCVQNGSQAAIMAPTEILAQQHFATFKRLFAKGHFSNIKSTLLISSLPAKEKASISTKLAQGEIDLIIGTHGLIENDVIFKDLALVIIDEQHKFGVEQRSALSSKGKNPHVLVMTATPIPRTLCLTLYGDLDVTTIDQMPSGRGKINTYHFPMDKSSGVYEKVRQWVKAGTQAYIVYPMIEESETLDLKTAKSSYEHFKANEFSGLRIALIHGQLKRNEVDRVMEQFKAHEIDILVSTTILEVGIDVPNANVMVIEHADRFGLSQLHQMRGRIGRGSKDAVCILLGDPTTQEGKARLETIVKTIDGFEIAEKDLEIRGPGHYFGKFQHGVNELKITDPIGQIKILESARKEAINLTSNDAQLKKPVNITLKKSIKRRFPEYLDLILAG